jgi:hypothetical protein
MNRYVNGLLYVDSNDSLARVLQSWRLWLAGAVVGVLLSSAVYAVFPPPYRARAVVVVDFNIEEVWKIAPSKQFYFLGRESRKLEELAWSDETMQLLADEVGDVTVRELRDEFLSLSQPDDGAWYFFADHPDADRAEQIASAWAKVFYQQASNAVEVSADLELMRQQIPLIFDQYPDISSGEALDKLRRDYPDFTETKGISPYIEMSLSQIDDLKIVRKVPMSVYILSGAMIGACSFAFAGLLFLREEEKNAFLAE